MRRVAAAAAVALVLAACPAEPVAPAPSVKAAVLRAADTVRFEARAVAHRCAGGRGVLFEAVGAGNGVLVWLRDPRDSMLDTFPVVGARDSVTYRGAVVALRFVVHSVVHSVALDSGVVVVARPDSTGARALRLLGSGLDVAGGARAGLDASFDALASAADSTACDRGP